MHLTEAEGILSSWKNVPTQVFKLKAKVFGTSNSDLRVALFPPVSPVSLECGRWDGIHPREEITHAA
jgi:hypothetical protein